MGSFTECEQLNNYSIIFLYFKCGKAENSH